MVRQEARGSLWYCRLRCILGRYVSLSQVPSHGSNECMWSAGVVFPIMFSHLVDKLGFGSTLQIMAFVCLMLLFIATFILRSRKTRNVGRPDFLEPVRAVRENAAYRWLLVGVFFGFWG
jgi:hypothetical protein